MAAAPNPQSLLPMEPWHEAEGEEEEGGQGLDRAFTVLSDGPPARAAGAPPPPPWRAAGRALRLAAHPPLYAGETEALRLARADARDAVCAALDARADAALAATDAAVFDALLEMARGAHPRPGAPRARRHGLVRAPAGLVLAGGVNSADGERAFPALAEHLRAGGCYVALLRADAFARGLPEALGAALRGLSGLAAPGAAGSDALAAWYEEEAGEGGGEEEADEAEGAEGSEDEGVDAAAGGGASPPPSPGGTRRRRGERRAPAVPAAARCAAARRRPLVIIVEGVEGVEPGALADFVTSLSENHSRLPATLVLGLTTTAAALTAALPPALVDRALACRHFSLATAFARLDTLVREVLLDLNGWPGLLFGAGVVAELWELFLLHYFSPAIVRLGLRAAAVRHFARSPASHLAAALLPPPGALAGGVYDGRAAGAALAAAVAALPPAGAAAARAAARAPARGGSAAGAVAGAVAAAAAAARAWALALHWTVAAGAAAGLGSGFTYWQLYRDALAPGFAAGRGRALLARLERGLRRLDARAAAALGARLAELAERAGAPGGGGAPRGGEWADEARAGLAAARRALEAGEEEEAADRADAPAPVADEPPPTQELPASQEPPATQSLAEPAAAAAAPPPPPGGPARRAPRPEKYYSVSSRRQAIIAMSLKAGAAGGGGAAAAPAADAAPPPTPPTPAERFAAWLAGALAEGLRTPPWALPGAAPLCATDASAVACLTAAPRAAVHAALTRPELILGRCEGDATSEGEDEGAEGEGEGDGDGAGPSGRADADADAGAGGATAPIGLRAGTEDSALAYQLFDQAQHQCATAGEWLAAFADVHAGGADGGKKRARGGGGGAAGAAGVAGGAAGAAEAAARRRELVARFSHAAAELQFVGLLRPARRRRGDAVERVVHMPAAGAQ